MRLPSLNTGTKILGAFAIVSLLLVSIAVLALWRMQAADALATDLVQDKLAKQQMTSELLGLARLNGSRTVSIARSDSLELADYFLAELGVGQQQEGAITARLAPLVHAGREQALLASVRTRQATRDAVRTQLLRLKETGQTQAVDALVAGDWARADQAHLAALDALLKHATQAARALRADAARASATSRAWLAGVTLAALAIGAALAWLLTRNLVRPLQQAVGLAEQVARGDLRASIGHTRSDEIGRLFDALNGMTRSVSGTMTEVLQGARGIDAASNDIAHGNEDLSQRTERQAEALRDTAHAMDALTLAIASNNHSAREANLLAQSASEVANEGAGAVAQLVNRMQAISASADRIVDITGMIDSIAFQTNILALNAAVEAARAGAEGRGFAVVAAEVRNLAQHSAGAAREIKQLIGESAEQIRAGTGIAGAAGDTMRAVLDKVQGVASLLGTIHGASEQQALGVAEVGRAIAEIDASTQQNAAMVEQAAAAAASMREQAGALAQLVATFQVRKQGAAPLLPAQRHG